MSRRQTIPGVATSGGSSPGRQPSDHDDGSALTIQDYLRILQERWVIVVSATVIAVIGAGAAWASRPAEYTANLTMYVSAQVADTATAAYQGACCPSSGCRPTSSWSAAPA
jgi:uncharacterized protein involved in exopolysaccharide biosynthesis